MSVKKSIQGENTVDPIAAALVTRQVRDLLRFHQTMGIKGYPADTVGRNFLRNKAAVVDPAPASATRDPRGRTAEPQAVAKPQQNVFQPSAAPAGTLTTPSQDALAAEPSLQAILQEITSCSACRLAEKRLGQVIGIGSKTPSLMVVGDWSRQEGKCSDEILFGAEEDVMLWRMMEAIGLARKDVYVTNAIKCCPAGETPEPVSGERCRTYLGREIAALKPGLILSMGELATHQLLGVAAPLVRLRGRFHQYRYPDSAPARVMPTFHPRFLLAHQEMKKMVWQDLQMMQRQLG